MTYQEFLNKQADEQTTAAPKQAPAQTAPTPVTGPATSKPKTDRDRLLARERGYNDAYNHMRRQRLTLFGYETNIPNYFGGYEIDPEWDKWQMANRQQGDTDYQMAVGKAMSNTGAQTAANAAGNAAYAQAYIPFVRDYAGKTLAGGDQTAMLADYASVYGPEAAQKLADQLGWVNAGVDLVTETALTGVGVGAAGKAVGRAAARRAATMASERAMASPNMARVVTQAAEKAAWGGAPQAATNGTGLVAQRLAGSTLTNQQLLKGLQAGAEAGNRFGFRYVTRVADAAGKSAEQLATKWGWRGITANGIRQGLQPVVNSNQELADAATAEEEERAQLGADYATQRLSGIKQNVDTAMQQLIDNGQVDPNNKEQLAEARQSLAYDGYLQQISTGVVPQGMWTSDDFKNMSAEQQASIYKTYAAYRLQTQNVKNHGKWLGSLQSGIDMFNHWRDPGSPVARAYDQDQEFREQTQAFMAQASPEVLLSLAMEQAGSGPQIPGRKGKMETSTMASDLKNIISRRFADDSNFGAKLLLAAQNNQQGSFKADPQMIKDIVTNINNVGADKWMQGLSQENYLALGQMFLSNKEGLSALDSLGEEGKKFKDAMLSAARGAAFGQIMKDPTNLHQFAALWFQSKGWDTMAGIARDTPIAFYGGLAALVLGGGMLISSLFGDDDDEEDEERQQGPQMAYNPRLLQLNLADYS